MSQNYADKKNTQGSNFMPNKNIELSEEVFKVYQKLIFSEIGISLDHTKRSLVQSRLYKRILFYKLNSYTEYLRIVQINNSEKMEMLNLITTNETYFFREESHFNFLIKQLKHSDETFRVWSAASSVGAEAYTIAMILNNYLHRDTWEVLGSDINTEVIKKARTGLYPLTWMDKIPDEYKKKYCLIGKGKYDKQFLVHRSLAKSVTFTKNNLMVKNREFGLFDIIFIRNVLIYFNDKTKEHVIKNIMANLKPNGYLIISLTESLKHLKIKSLEQVATSIYQKKG